MQHSRVDVRAEGADEYTADRGDAEKQVMGP